MASTLITVGQLMEHIETDLSDDALERLLESADTDITRGFGPHDGERTVTFYPVLSQSPYLLTLPNPAASVSLITEGTDDTVVDSDDYTVEYNGRAVLKNKSRWLPPVDVTYTPIADNPRRIAVLIDLVKVEIQYRGLNTERVGSYSVTYMDHDKERQNILARLRQNYAGAGLLV